MLDKTVKTVKMISYETLCFITGSRMKTERTPNRRSLDVLWSHIAGRRYRFFIPLYLLFLSTAGFSQQGISLIVTGDIPDADDPHIYQIQAGAFLNTQNALNAFDRLNRISLNPVLEQHGPYTRVVINDIKANEVLFYFEQLASAGFTDLIIRFDPMYESLMNASEAAATAAAPTTAEKAPTATPQTTPPKAAVPAAPQTTPPAAAETAVPKKAAAAPETAPPETAAESDDKEPESADTTNIIEPEETPPEPQTDDDSFTPIIGDTTFTAKERRVGIGLGPELNMNSGSNFGVGVAVAVDINFSDFWAAGVAFKGSHDLSSAWVFEGGGFLRRYIPGDLTQEKGKHSGFFLQADIGVHLILEDNVFMYEGDSLLRFMGGVRTGFRFLPGSRGRFFLEPFIRGGYPFLWGAGLLAGMRF